ncbi:hypothetical protein [Streptomyces bohaiensis]|uniref:hypothetical protein n=1 Tax=Streptomyces bohaiensis TaxID=1431344 RepID=UPI003B7F9C77
MWPKKRKSQLEITLAEHSWFEEHPGLTQAEEVQNLRIECNALEAALVGLLGARTTHQRRRAEQVVDECFQAVREEMHSLPAEEEYESLRDYLELLRVAYGKFPE